MRAKAAGPEREMVFVDTEGTEGVLDTGASRTVLGSARVSQMVRGLPAACRSQVKKVASDITFRFGNSGTLTSKFALMLPAAGGTWVRIEVILGILLC